MKCAQVYTRCGRLFVCPQSLTTDELWIDQDPVAVLETNSSASDKGRALLSALALSRVNVPHPTSWHDRNKVLLSAAGVKNWKTFSKDATSVCVEWDDAGISFVPYENQGSDGLVEIDDGRIVIKTSSSDEAVGAALERALTLAR
jgi:hypothetical protein